MSESCDLCGHEKSMGRCWRLTCPTNGARESFEYMQRKEGLKIEPIPPSGFEHIPPQARTMADASPYTVQVMSREQFAMRFSEPPEKAIVGYSDAEIMGEDEDDE
jgi:hypothetical protein